MFVGGNLLLDMSIYDFRKMLKDLKSMKWRAIGDQNLPDESNVVENIKSLEKLLTGSQNKEMSMIIDYENQLVKEKVLYQEFIENKKKKSRFSKLIRLYIEYLIRRYLDWSCNYFSNHIRALYIFFVSTLAFSMLYCVFANQIMSNDTPIRNISFIKSLSSIHVESLNSFVCLLCETLSIIVKSLVFSIISAVTIGYGNMYPIGLMSFLAGIQGIFSILQVSFITVTLTRRYTN